MAYMYINTKIIKHAQGKSAVASAAYQSGSQLYCERLGETFSYRNKEEVVYSEIMLPDNAPIEFRERSNLWNAVEAKETRTNARYARQFIIALPKEWSTDESIDRMRQFIKEKLVDGQHVAVDFSIHNKENNPHAHIMCTNRPFKKNGDWGIIEKKVFDLDADGNRIPLVDPKTGEQKLRIRERNGVVSTEKLWKKKTIEANAMNSRQFLKEFKSSWQEYANRSLAEEDKMRQSEYSRYELVPLKHEGPSERRNESWMQHRIIENDYRRKINEELLLYYVLIKIVEKLLELLSRIFQGEEYGQERSYREIRTTREYESHVTGKSEPTNGNHKRIGKDESREAAIIRLTREAEEHSRQIKKHHRHR